MDSLPSGCQFPAEGGESKVYLLPVEEMLFAVVQQPFVEGDQASLDHIEGFLNFNGFTKVRRQDYYNSELKLALEDMHDENVISKGEILFFIDTVFYIM